MAKISDEVRSYFVADTGGLERGVSTATRLLDNFNKKDRQAALEMRKNFAARADATKNLILDPGGAARQGIDKLVSSMKMSAVTTGLVSAGVSMAADAISRYREEAKAAREETNAFNESFRRNYQANIHLSGAQDSGTLMGKLADLRDQQTVLKQRDFDLNPEEGSAAAMQLHNRYNVEDPMHARDNLVRDQEQAKMQLYGNDRQQAAIQRDITDSLTRQNKLVTNRLQGSSAQAQIMDLRAARRREIDDLKNSTA